MKSSTKKSLKNILKKIPIIIISLSFLLSNVPFGFFEYYFDKLGERKIVDLMWIAENSSNVVDNMTVDRAYAAENIIESDTIDTTDEFGPSPTVVFTTNQTGYLFFVDAINGLVYRKTTNGGTNWAVPVVIDNTLTGWTNVSIWYDQWTPGDTTGTKIHIAAADDVSDDVYYSYLDTNGDNLKGNMVTVISQTAFTEAANAAPSITKGGAGDLFITANFATTAGGYVYKSSDGAGDTWTDTTPSGWSNASIDQVQLLPLKTNNDIIAIKAETASNAMKYQIYDEVLNSWAGTWTNIGTMVENTTYDQWFSATLNKTSGDVYLTFANYTNNVANDIEFWSLPDDTRTFSKKTDVRQDNNQLLSPVPLVDDSTGDIYVAYLEGQTNFSYSAMGINIATYVYYHKSTDGGETWSERQGELNNNVGDDFKYLRGGIASSDRLYVAYYDDDDNDIFGTTIFSSGVPVEANIDTAILDATDEYGPSPSGVFLDEDVGYQFYTRTNNVLDATDEFGPSPTVVFTDANTGYIFFIDSPSQDLVYRKTINGGINWSGSMIIDTDITGWTNVSIWYDQWTPGDTTGTKIHIAAADDVSDDVYYSYLDTNGDNLKGNMVTVIPQTAFTEAVNAAPSITKGGGGDLFITANFATTAGGYVYKSSDGSGNSWSNITPGGWSTVSADQIQLLPLLTDNDIIAIKAETATNMMKYQVYDEVANTWAGTWTDIATMVDNTTYDQWFSATLNKTTGDTYLTFANYTNNVANDIEFWSLPDETRTFSKSATNVISDISSAIAPVPFYKEDTGTIYVAYARGTINSSMHVYFKSSTDGGATWSTESSALSTTTDDFKYLRGNMMGAANLFVAWYNDDTNVIRGDKILSPVAYDLPISGVQSVVYRKTINGGASWGPPYTVANMVGATSVAVWYDQWTPGDTTGTKIHVAFSDDQTDDYYYVNLDTSNDKPSQLLPVLLGTVITELSVGVPSITKGGGGDLFLSGNFNTTAGGKVAKSSDGGQSWTEITPFGWSTVAVDQIQLLPLKTGNDIIAIKAETAVASDKMKYQIYDELENSWAGTWTDIASMIDNATYDQWFSASLKKSSGDIYLTFANYTNNAANDIEFWSFPDDGRSWSRGADVYQDTANAIMPTMLVDDSSGDLYVAYLRGTLNTEMNVYYKKSTDGGETWSSESATLSPGIADDVKALRGNLLSNKRLYVFWYNDDLNDIYGNTVAKIEASVAGGIGQSAFRFFENINSLDVGSPLALINTVATLLSSYRTEFRLRLILSIVGQTLLTTGQNFKLQFALKSGECDSAFIGETYEDVTYDTDIAYYENYLADNNDALVVNLDDPIDVELSSISAQSYVESNNFTNLSEILSLQGGLWDFSLQYRGTTSNQSYCLRVVKEDGSLLDSYPNTLPEIITAQYRSRGGGSVQYIEEVDTPDDQQGNGNGDVGEGPVGDIEEGQIPDAGAGGGGAGGGDDDDLGFLFKPRFFAFDSIGFIGNILSITFMHLRV